MRLARYVHTLRHLRPVQVYGRLWHRLHTPAPDLRPPPALRKAEAGWPGPALRPVSLVAPGRLRLLAEERDIRSSHDWRDAHPAMLWMYNLHYFEDLNAPEDAVRTSWQRELIESWLEGNPPVSGCGWDPYPISLRTMSWVRWLLRGNAPVPRMIESLAIQARHLRRRLEHHLLGNHLFVNAKALVIAGTFFEGPEADAWRNEGHRLLERELAEQLLADGGHFERSPMYQALLLEDLLDLLALEEVYPGTSTIVSRLRRSAAAMLTWLQVMTHPDGDIALFNDATLGVAATTEELARYARRVGVATNDAERGDRDLAASGYTRVERAGAVLIADTAPLGPNYLLGHGHADTLSFELTIAGRRLIVDSGVSEYGTSSERLRQRGTAAHNTVVVDQCDSSEVWSGFRVARRARIEQRAIDLDGETARIRAAHTGYRRLPGRVTHARSWSMRDGVLEIDDELRGGGTHLLEVVLHLAPEVRPERRDDTTWALGEQVEMNVDPALRWSALPSTYHPAMGVRVPTWRLLGTVESTLPQRIRTRITWK